MSEIVVVDSMGRIRLPVGIFNEYKIYPGMEIAVVKTSLGYTLAPVIKSFETCCHEWWDKNHSYIALNLKPKWRRCDDYTMCIVEYNGDTHCGIARRMHGDTYDPTVGAVASYARAMGIPVNELVNYKGG